MKKKSPRQNKKLAAAAYAPTLTEAMDIIKQMESDYNPNAMGDRGTAYGILQVRAGCLADANLWLGKKYRLEDMLGTEGVPASEEVFEAYMARYATQKRLGRAPLGRDYAGIWNGGPWGFNRTSTRGYREKFRQIAVARFGEAVVV